MATELNGGLWAKAARFVRDFGLFLILCLIAYLSYQNNRILRARNGIFNDMRAAEAETRRLVLERCGGERGGP